MGTHIQQMNGCEPPILQYLIFIAGTHIQQMNGCEPPQFQDTLFWLWEHTSSKSIGWWTPNLRIPHFDCGNNIVWLHTECHWNCYTHKQIFQYIQADSLFSPAATISWVLLFCMTCIGHQAPDCARDAIAPCYSAVTRQRNNHTNNKLSWHLVGTLTLHWQPLYISKSLIFKDIWRKEFKYNKLFVFCFVFFCFVLVFFCFVFVVVFVCLFVCLFVFQ